MHTGNAEDSFFSLLKYLSESKKKKKGYIYLTGLSSVQLLNLIFKVSAFLLSEKKTSKWHIHSLLSQTFHIKCGYLYINSFYQLSALQTPPRIRTELDCDLPTAPTTAIYEDFAFVLEISLCMACKFRIQMLSCSHSGWKSQLTVTVFVITVHLSFGSEDSGDWHRQWMCQMPVL